MKRIPIQTCWSQISQRLPSFLAFLNAIKSIVVKTVQTWNEPLRSSKLSGVILTALKKSSLSTDSSFFRLSILMVDQRTPINIHFTVDVVKWPLEMTTSTSRYSWFPRISAYHNHRVRMRMKLGGTVGRGISPTYNWPPTSPETSLSYRWNLVTNLDKYLRPECGPHCGVGIMLIDIQRQGKYWS